MNAEDEIVQLIEGMAGKYSPYVIFADWVKMYAIAIQNACSMQDKAWQARESQYMDVSRKYDHKEMSTFCQMNAPDFTNTFSSLVKSEISALRSNADCRIAMDIIC